MFGRRQPDGGGKAMTPENAPTGKSNNVTGFDPEVFERAAKAARELDNSRNANAAMELVKTQEATKQHEAAAKRAEMDAYAQQMKQQNIEREGDEARKTLDHQSQHDKRRVEYQDELERKRQVDMLNAQKYMQEEQLKKQEEMVARQEEMRRKTAQLENELRTKTEVAKVKAESEGKITQERMNHDLILEKVKLEATENRDTVLKAVADGGRLLGEGLSSYLNDVDKLRNTAFTITGIAVGIFTARTSIGIAGRYIEARMGKPSLVRETSRFTVGQFVREPISSMQRIFGMGRNEEDALKGIVLENRLQQQLRKIAISTANTKKNRAPFRHLLLHGPPGTGKTMFARNLAKHSGLDYAIFTGGDIAPLGRDGVTELHKLFDWAKTSRRGLLLFVDEADAFLKSRGERSTGTTTTTSISSTSTGATPTRQQNISSGGAGINTTMSEDQRNALNAFLYRTGTESDQFMMVYASNQPSQFDSAILDRVDEMIHFDLPGDDERRQIVLMYMEQYLLHPPNPYTKRVVIEDDEIGTKEIEQVVQMTKGFSGRALSKLVIAWQAAAYGTANATLDRETFFATVEQHKQSMYMKEQWALEQQGITASRADMLTTDA